MNFKALKLNNNTQLFKVTMNLVTIKDFNYIHELQIMLMITMMLADYNYIDILQLCQNIIIIFTDYNHVDKIASVKSFLRALNMS